jgi:NHLM bacteriocin system ABC transporter peptidase/ATP-binding protein
MSVLHRRVPTILQQEAVECGAACLAMVLGYHGRWMRLEELRELCGVSRDGTKASNIVKAARRLNMIAKGLRREPDKLADLPMPFIVFWNFNHFVVVESIAAGPTPSVRIVDPASGPRTLTYAEFDAGFTGVALAFETGPGFKPEGERPSLSRMLRGRLHGYGPALALTVVAGLLLLAPGVLSANLTRIFVDDILGGGHADWLWPVLGALAALAVLRGLLMLVQQRALARAQAAFAATIAVRLMWTVLHLPLGFFAQRYPGDIANRFMMGDRLGAVALGGLAPAALSAITVVGYGAALFFFDTVLAVITIGFALLALLLYSISASGIEQANRRQVADEGRLRATTIQGLSMIEEFRAAGMETRFVGRWSGYQARVTDAEQASGARTAVLMSGAGMILAVGAVAVLAAGAVRVIDGAMGLGTLLAFQLLAAGFAAPLLTLVAIGGQAQQLRGLAERLDDVERAAPPEPQRVPATAQTDASGLELRNVSFGYTPLDEPFIQGFSLRVPAGSRVALVGGSGSGKSTLGRLMIGLIAPREGEVCLDSVALPDWDPVTLRSRISYVDQTIGLFQGRISDNLSLWDPLLPEVRMVRAAQDAVVHDAILRRPGGYSALLDEDGNNLSGGERQRMALARALAALPRLLVLDEATSALDAPAEHAVMDAVRQRGCTCVVIAHRLSAIRDCDQIVVLDHGRIIEQGRHDELMAIGGHYRLLVEH